MLKEVSRNPKLSPRDPNQTFATPDMKMYTSTLKVLLKFVRENRQQLDASKTHLYTRVDNIQYVWFKLNTEFQENNLINNVKHGSGGGMV